jgi:hypothetical protein
MVLSKTRRPRTIHGEEASMRLISTLVVVLACVACQPQPDPMQIALAPGQPQSGQSRLQAKCDELTVPVTVGGKPEQASARSCRQPDGSWRVVQDTPGLPTQDYLVPPSGETASPATTAAQSPADQSPCTSYTVPVTVGGQQLQAVMESCRQPDGSLRITQNTPGLPLQVYVVPPPAEYSNGYLYPDYYAYPFYYPYWAAEPWFFGLGPTIVMARRFSLFRHGFHGGFAHGFHHGFGGGFSGGHGSGRGGGHR